MDSVVIKPQRSQRRSATVDRRDRYFSSLEPFPVDFDELWQWVGFAKKHKAKEMLIRNFERNIEFSTSWVKTPNGGRPRENIRLTIDTSKEFALLAQTENGKAYRRYLIQVEKLVREQNKPQISKALKAAREVREITDTLDDNPRLAQYLIDHAVSECLEQPLPSLPGSDEPQLRGVVEIAEDMDLPVNIKNRSSLGKFVKNLLPELSFLEKRLVNGTMREVNCYPDVEEVRKAIRQFFE